MLYFLLIIGIILFIYGFNKTRQSGKNFEMFYSQAAKQEMHLVNHTIDEEKLKNDVENLQREMDIIKKIVYKNVYLPKEQETSEKDDKNNSKKLNSENQLFQKFLNSDEDKVLEQLSKEMGIGKGELLLLKKLSPK